ncbi:MAG: GatB/YqeY domain-containing protein [Anaerolineaceae bacterium]|jgi:uncharacterized protein YqeY|nr:GatB/YqeY domain-containing protein [Anaerolineaceae bacterium]
MDKKQEIQTALTAAMKARDEDTKRTLRLVMAAVKLAEVETGQELDDARILSILQKEVKTREDMIAEANKAGRDDLRQAAERELDILGQFLPKQMSADELTALAKSAIEEAGATEMKDMGKVMGLLIPRLEGRASGQDASKAVRELLQK